MKTIISFIVVLLASVLMAQSVDRREEIQHSDNLDIQYAALFPRAVSDSETPLASAPPRNCTNHICQRLCLALYYRYGRCISSTVCRCSN